MAGDNLTVTIGADTSKLRGELKLAGAQLKQLGREVDAAVKKGNVDLAERLSQQYGSLQSRIVGVNRELKGTAGALDQVTAAGGRMRLQFRNLGGSLETIAGQLGRLGGGLFGGLIGGAVISGIREVTKALDDQIERITKIRDLARDIARSPASVAASQAVGRATGETEDVITKALQTQAANFAELERRRIGTVSSQSREAQAKRDELIQQRARLLGGVPMTQRGGSEEAAAIDLSKIYEILVVDVARFKGNAEAAANFIDKSFLQIAKSGRLTETQLNEVSKALYGISAPAATKLATANIEKFNAELANSKKATDTAIKSAEELAAAQGKASNEANKALAPMVEAYTQLKIAIAEGQAQILKGGVTGVLKQQAKQTQDTMKAEEEAANQTWEAIGAGFTALVQKITTGWAETADAEAKTSQTTQGIGKTISDVWKATFGSIIGSAQAAEVRVSASAKGMSASFVVAAKDIQNAMAAALGAVTAVQGGLNMAQGAAQLAAAVGAGGTGPSVFRGGTGFPSPYGPVDTGSGGYGPRGSGFRETASPSRGGDPREGGTSTYLQSYAPGMSNYQALPPHMVSPIDYSEAMGWGSAIRDATEAAKEAAQASQQAAEASKTAADAWVDQVNRLGSSGFASGGMVTGPGSGTSDSIMARLSNGEFVMRAAAVRNLGAGFLSNLNRFAGGGMVMPSRGVPRFAEGGLVAAGAGGAPVHLHLGGHSFALSGSTGVVDALVVEARRQQVRSAGVKPSWYGGRPGGH